MAKGWYWRGNVAYYDFEIDGQRFRGSLKIKKDSGIIEGKSPAERADKEVRALMVQHEQHQTIETVYQQTQKRLAGVSGAVYATFEAIWDLYRTKGMSTAGEDRKKIYASHLKQFCDWLCDTRKDIKIISQINTDCAKEYITWLREQPGAPATKNDKLATLRMIFGVIADSSFLPINPFDKAKIKKMPNQGVTRRIFTPEQIHQLFTESSGWMRKLFITGLATFQREEDCCLLKKSFINLQNNRVVFPFTHKTMQNVDIPMLPLFRSIVEESMLDPNNDTEYVFPELANLYHTNQSYIGKSVKKFLLELGIRNAVVDIPGYSRRVSVLDVHSLRHTAAVMAVLSGWPISMVMKATGHRSMEMVMRYVDHISEEQKENYFFQFGQGISAFPTGNEDSEIRKRLANLAQTLPLEEVKRLLEIARPAIETTAQATGLHLLG